MDYIIAAFAGMLLGGLGSYFVFLPKRARLREEREQWDGELARQKERLAAETVNARRHLEEQRKEWGVVASREREQLNVEASRTRQELADESKRMQASRESTDRRQRALEDQATKLRAAQAAFDRKVISYDDLLNESAILKRDLRNICVVRQKAQLDLASLQTKQAEIDDRSKEIAKRYLEDNVKWISNSLTTNNYAACKERLLAVIERCRGVGFDVSTEEEARLVGELKSEFEDAVRTQLQREEQARIKAKIREEQQLQREVERELKQVDRERAAIQAALALAMANAKDEHSAQVEELKARLADAEARAQRAISQAQLTRAGNVYVISNIGAFGDSVFKIGMTRRLEPVDRIRELGDASVPFPFDVHMMLSSSDAPALENALHRAFHKQRINKMNPRKEFFKVDLESIRRVATENHGEVQYVAEPDALEYRQSLTMSEADQEFVESVYDKLLDDGENVDE